MLTEEQNDGDAENSIPPKTMFCGGINKLGHMNKMVAMFIYGKIP